MTAFICLEVYKITIDHVHLVQQLVKRSYLGGLEGQSRSATGWNCGCGRPGAPGHPGPPGQPGARGYPGAPGRTTSSQPQGQYYHKIQGLHYTVLIYKVKRTMD